MKNFAFPKGEHPLGTENIEPDLEDSEFPEQHEFNITEGGEFLDDSIRMKDQPLIESVKQPKI